MTTQHHCKDCVRVPDRPLPKIVKSTCKFYIHPPPVYEEWVERYGFCSNRERFLGNKQFSIYNRKVCWTLNLQKTPNWCECIDCPMYEYENLVARKGKSILTTVKGSWLGHPLLWLMKR